MSAHLRRRGGRNRNRNRRRAVVAVQVGILLVVLIGFAALTVDVGTLYNTRADLQRTADAAALAGASAYTTDAMMQIRMEAGTDATLSYIKNLAVSRATQLVGLNPTFGTTAMSVAPEDIATGWVNLNSASEVIHTNPQPFDFNAIRVLVRREAGGGEGTNGPVQFFFAPIFGKQFGESSASAVAAFDDRFSSFSVAVPGAPMLPFSIHKDAFMQDLNEGGDQYAYDAASGTITETSDGIREVRLYPYPLSGSGYEEGDGNFGILNIGTGDQGVDAEVQQILNGVSAEDMEAEIGTAAPTFFDENGDPVTYDITGSPGMESALKDALGEMVGQVVGFFLHENVVLSGSNTIYTITTVRFGRVMDLRLTAQPWERGFYIQPVSYSGAGVRIDPQAPSSGGLVGRIVLTR